MKKVDDTTPAPCGHRGCRLKPSEVRAQLLASTALDDPDLTRVCDQDEAVAGGAIPDFRSRRHVVEVKELTSQALRRFIDLYESLPQRYIPNESFRYLWAVSVDVSRAAGAYGGNPKTPEVKTLIATLTQLIEDLESRGITNSLADHENFPKYAKALGFYCNCAVVPDSPLGRGSCCLAPSAGKRALSTSTTTSPPSCRTGWIPSSPRTPDSRWPAAPGSTSWSSWPASTAPPRA